MKDFDTLEAEIYAQITAAEAEQKHTENRIMKAIRSVKGDAFAADVESCIHGDSYCTGLSFTRYPKGKYDFEGEFDNIPGYWVDQWCNGGFTGDDFAGDIYIQLKENLYLRAGYTC